MVRTGRHGDGGDGPRQVNGRPDIRYFFIPTADLNIEPTWQDSAAMRGTGSNAANVQEVFVPEALAIGASTPLLIDRPVFRQPPSLLFFPIGVGIAFGVLESALQRAIDDLGGRCRLLVDNRCGIRRRFRS